MTISSARLLAGALGLMGVVFASAGAFAVDTLDVSVDRASILRAPDGVSTVIVGNPLIADALTQRNNVIVVTGKSFGSTNIMLLDGAGAVISETIVNVNRPNDSSSIVVQRGGKRESFACTPRCEPVLAIGDNPETFGQTAGQIAQRGGMSSGAQKAE